MSGKKTPAEQFDLDVRAIYFDTVHQHDDGIQRDEAEVQATEAVYQAIADNKLRPPGDLLASVIDKALKKGDNAAPPLVGKYLRQPPLFPDDPIWSTPVRLGGGQRKSLGWCTTTDLSERYDLIDANRKLINARADEEQRLTVLRIGEMQMGGHQTVRSAVIANAFRDWTNETDDPDWGDNS